MTRGEVSVGDVVLAWSVLGGPGEDRQAMAALLGFDVDPASEARVFPRPVAPTGPAGRPDAGPAEVPRRAPVPREQTATGSPQPARTVEPRSRASAYRRHLRPTALAARPRDPAPTAVRAVLPGHPGGVAAVAFSPDGLLVASAGHDGLVLRTSLDTGLAAGPPLSVPGRPVCLAVRDDGVCWVGVDDGRLLRLGAPGDVRAATVPGPRALAAVPGGREVLVGTAAGELVLVDDDGLVTPVGRADAEPGGPVAVAVSASGARVAAIGGDGAGSVVSRSGEYRKKFRFDVGPVSLALGRTDEAGNDDISVVGSDGGLWRAGVILPVPGPVVPAARALSPGAARVAVVHAEGSVTVRELRGGTAASVGAPSGAGSAVVAPRTLPPRSDAPAPPLPLEPLFSPRVTAGLLTLMLATPDGSATVDLDALVELVARRCPLDRLPLAHRRSLARGVQLLVDDGAGMTPFRRDAEALADAVYRVVGRGGAVERRTIVATPFDEASPPYVYPPPGRPVLALSDLGIAATPGTPHARGLARDWERLAAGLRRRGSELLALTPYPPHRWPPRLRSAMAVITWDRSTSARHVRAALDTAAARGAGTGIGAGRPSRATR